MLGAAGKLNALDVVPQSHDFVPRLAGAAADGVGEPSFWEQKYNLWSGLFGGLFLMMAYFGCDQSQVQRILTNPSANQSRKALLVSAFAKVPMQFGVLFIGVLIYLFHALNGGPMLYKPSNIERANAPENVAQTAEFEARYRTAWTERRELLLQIAESDRDLGAEPELLRRYQRAIQEVAKVRSEAAAAYDEDEKKDDTNYIFPHFILHNLHPLLLGLIIAAIFAAAMSSVDSVLNSLSAATIVDFYQRWIRPGASDRRSLRAGRIATLFWGVSATAFALFFAGGGSLIEQINKFGSYFYGSLLGVFALALLVPRARGWAGFLGLLGGMASVLAVHRTIAVEFLWYNVVGCLGVLAVGWVVSRFEE